MHSSEQRSNVKNELWKNLAFWGCSSQELHLNKSPFWTTMKIASNEEKGLRTLEQLTNIRPFLKTSKARTVSKQRKKKQLDAKEY